VFENEIAKEMDKDQAEMPQLSVQGIRKSLEAELNEGTNITRKMQEEKKEFVKMF
jgi:hypothetical protein